jgi:hypothetical protein
MFLDDDTLYTSCLGGCNDLQSNLLYTQTPGGSNSASQQ